MTRPALTVGVTASRHGSTPEQLAEIRTFLEAAGHGTLVHGNCLGGDEAVAEAAHELGWRVVARPGDTPRWQSTTAPYDYAYPPEPNLVRNRKIVDECHFLFALPKESVEPKPARGQGTWSTVRYARKTNVMTGWIIWPDGGWEAVLPAVDESRVS